MRQRWESWKNKYGRWCYEAPQTSECFSERRTSNLFYQSWSYNSSLGPATLSILFLVHLNSGYPLNGLPNFLPLYFPHLLTGDLDISIFSIAFWLFLHLSVSVDREQIKLSAFLSQYWVNIVHTVWLFPFMSRWQLPLRDRRCSLIKNLIYTADKLFMP